MRRYETAEAHPLIRRFRALARYLLSHHELASSRAQSTYTTHGFPESNLERFLHPLCPRLPKTSSGDIRARRVYEEVRGRRGRWEVDAERRGERRGPDVRKCEGHVLGGGREGKEGDLGAERIYIHHALPLDWREQYRHDLSRDRSRKFEAVTRIP